MKRCCVQGGQFWRKKIQRLQGLSANFSRPILAVFYEVILMMEIIESLIVWNHMKTKWHKPVSHWVMLAEPLYIVQSIEFAIFTHLHKHHICDKCQLLQFLCLIWKVISSTSASVCSDLRSSSLRAFLFWSNKLTPILSSVHGPNASSFKPSLYILWCKSQPVSLSEALGHIPNRHWCSRICVQQSHACVVVITSQWAVHSNVKQL